MSEMLAYKVSWLNRSMTNMWVSRTFETLHGAARFEREQNDSAHIKGI